MLTQRDQWTTDRRGVPVHLPSQILEEELLALSRHMFASVLT
jgi:hypothetical protein